MTCNDFLDQLHISKSETQTNTNVKCKELCGVNRRVDTEDFTGRKGKRLLNMYHEGVDFCFILLNY